ncbi:hypothetical protein KP509_06G088400 [Ceratopteris richardii]|uniref:Uncharacterized protein n=1 Tax=Ceratopteris richardii TaxID=49495 RepID=A0A8T2UMP1_CERRI|nr:hypothetical protein KP509_06G088400 [Ceratopteris richardii]
MRVLHIHRAMHTHILIEEVCFGCFHITVSETPCISLHSTTCFCVQFRTCRIILFCLDIFILFYDVSPKVAVDGKVPHKMSMRGQYPVYKVMAISWCFLSVQLSIS